MNKNEKIIYLDMDGTIADFWNVKNCLDYVNAEKVYPYAVARPMIEEKDLLRLIAKGYKIGVITWTAMNGRKAYNEKVEKCKKRWFKRHFPNVRLAEWHCVDYGIAKDGVAQNPYGILVDDDKINRDWWRAGGGKAHRPEWLKERG